jgi:uncharacterized spore protein YtfJ
MEAIKALFERLGRVSQEVNVNAVFGTPETIDGITLIPVAEIMYGLGAGAGSSPSSEQACCEDHECCKEEDECCGGDECCCGEASTDVATDEDADEAETSIGAGGGAGAKARPIAYITVGPDGAKVQAIVDEQKVALAGILLGFWAIGWIGLVLKTLFTRRS